MGSIVYGADGEEHKINHEGVSKHPGDRGMEFIADKIVEKINVINSKVSVK